MNAAPRGDRDAERRARVPQVVDAERALARAPARPTMRASAATCTGGASSRYGRSFSLQNMHAVDALVEQDLEVAPHVVDRALNARARVVQRRPGQRRHVRHRDHGQPPGKMRRKRSLIAPILEDVQTTGSDPKSHASRDAYSGV